MSFCCLLVVLLLAKDQPLAEARERLLRGNYDEALALYEKAQGTGAIIGLSRVLQMQGEYEKALDRLQAAIAASPKDADLLASRAELLHFLGNSTEAAKAADSAIAIKEEQLLARWIRARCAWERGDLKPANDDLRWIIRYYGEKSNKEQDIKDPDQLLVIGQAATLNARWHKLGDQFSMILNDVYGEALKQEKSFWPAEQESGMLLLEKYNRAEAIAAFDKALTVNPRATDALIGKGLAAYQHYELREAEMLAERALKINPRHPQAHLLKADIYWMGSELDKTEEAIANALAVNPRAEAALGRKAACLVVKKDDKGLQALEKEVAGRNPTPGEFYLLLGGKLEERKRYVEAERYYKKAIELRPMIPEARNSLGMLHMRLGREAEAREVLTAAFAADEFNVRVSNSLKVLRHLQSYQTLETPHFEIRYDPKVDQPLIAYLAAQLEDTHALLKDEFQYAPPGKVLFEVFNNHEMFSGRTIALPDLHTIGASTGRIIAMVSPLGKGVKKPFNWGRVVRHELVHVFNLEQTNFQCPHWFTEGLAVLHEGFPRPAQWNQLLKERVESERLYNLDNIDLGFIRPRSPLDWTLAYAQSSLYVTYIRQAHGPKSIGLMLAAFAEGKDTGRAILEVCGTKKADFEAGYAKYLRELVKEMGGRPEEKQLSFGQLQRAFEKDPKNVDLASRLAEQLLIRRDRKEARKIVDTVLTQNPKHAMASYVKAKLLLDAGEDEQAKALLEAAFDRKQPDPKIVASLGKLYYETRTFDKAAEVYESALAAEPEEPSWLVELVRVYTQMGSRPKLMDALSRLLPGDAEDFPQRKRLALMLMEAKKLAEAEKIAREALEIDVRDAEMREVLDKALRGQNRAAEADALKKLFAGK